MPSDQYESMVLPLPLTPEGEEMGRAALLIDTATNAATRQRREAEDAWLLQQQPLLDSALATAAALQQVLQDTAAYVEPFLAVAWHEPREGRSHSHYHHLDNALDAYRSARRMLKQLQDVDEIVRTMARDHPANRNMGMTTTIVQNAVGLATRVTETVAYIRVLIDRITDLPTKGQAL